MLRSQKRKRGDKGSGTDTGNDIEFGSIASRSPTDQHSRTKRAAGPAPRKCQGIDCLNRSAWPVFLKLFSGPEQPFLVIRRNLIAPGSSKLYVLDVCCLNMLFWHRITIGQ